MQTISGRAQPVTVTSGYAQRMHWVWLTVMHAMGAPLVTLDASVEPFRLAFEEAAGQTRVVVFLSPTCRSCARGVPAFAELLSARPDLVPLVVWEPVLPKDGRPSRRLRKEMPERARLFWDRDRALSDTIVAAAQGAGATEALPDDSVVWDVVFLYGPERRWAGEGAFPLPDWWGAPVAAAVGPLGEELSPP